MQVQTKANQTLHIQRGRLKRKHHSIFMMASIDILCKNKQDSDILSKSSTFLFFFS